MPRPPPPDHPSAIHASSEAPTPRIVPDPSASAIRVPSPTQQPPCRRFRRHGRPRSGPRHPNPISPPFHATEPSPSIAGHIFFSTPQHRSPAEIHVSTPCSGQSGALSASRNDLSHLLLVCCNSSDRPGPSPPPRGQRHLLHLRLHRSLHRLQPPLHHRAMLKRPTPCPQHRDLVCLQIREEALSFAWISKQHDLHLHGSQSRFFCKNI